MVQENLGTFNSIQIVADLGEFTIIGHNGDNVLCEHNADKARFSHASDGKTLKLTCSYKARWFQWSYLWLSYLASGWPKASVQLFVPKDSDLDLRVFSGKVTIKNHNCINRIKMGSGTLLMDECKGELDVFTSSADVTVKGLAGHINLYSYTGDITVQGEFLPDKPNRLESMMGYVKVALKNANLSWTASAATGTITMLAPQGFVQKAKKAAWGSLGEGLGKLKLKTNIGNIEIKTE